MYSLILFLDHVLSVFFAIICYFLAIYLLLVFNQQQNPNQDKLKVNDADRDNNNVMQQEQDELTKDGKFECFRFPEENPVIWDGR